MQPSAEERFSERKGGPYLSFKQVLDQGQPQPEVNIPMSTSGAEKFIHCDFTPSCRYCAKSKRELDRHKCFHHDSVAPPVVEARPDPGASVGVDMPYDLDGCVPRPCAPSRKRGRQQRDAEDAGSGDDVELFQREEDETAGLFGDFSDVDGNVSPPGASKRVKQEVASSSGLAGTVGPTPDPETPGPWRGPAMRGGWDVVEVPGGWIKFNLEKGKLDAHCGNPHHGGPHTCKMDRAAKKRPLGGELLWLALCTDNLRKDDHDKLKAKVFEPDRKADRREKRIWLERKAAAERGKYQMLLDVEAAAARDVD